MIRSIKYILLALSALFLLFSLKTSREGLIVRDRINAIARYDKQNPQAIDSLKIQKLEKALTGDLQTDSLKEMGFGYHDLRVAIFELWKQTGISFYFHKIYPERTSTVFVFIGYFPDRKERRYVNISFDSSNQGFFCTTP